MEDLKLEAENRLRTSRHRRRAEAMAWMEQAREKIAERADLRQKLASTPAGDKVLTKDEVKVTLSQISLEWRETHKKERCSFLFHEVFPLLFQSGDLKTQDVKKFRLMSKQSKESVDNCLSSVTKTRRYCQEEEYAHYLIMLPLPIPYFSSRERVVLFNDWARRHYSGQNPFFSRHLDIVGSYDDMPGNQEFWRGMENLLRRWGTQIWHVVIQFDMGKTPKEVYRQLAKLLILMPNLRSIQLQDHIRGFINPWADLSIPGPLKVEMRKCPLPELPHLAYIGFNPFVPPSITHAMLSKYKQTLKEINGELIHEGCKGMLMKVFRTISNCPPPAKFEGPFGSLTDLSMGYDVGEGSTVPEFFKNVNDCGPSVRRVALSVENFMGPRIELSGPILKSLSLELPNLESIRLLVARVNLDNIDFLLPCQSLKQIILRYTKRMDDQNETEEKKGSSGAAAPSAAPAPPGDVIQFTGYVNRLYESNIWELFPDLKLVSIQDKQFTAGQGPPPIGEVGDYDVYEFTEGEHPLLPNPNNTVTTTKLYTREGFRRRQLKKD